MSRLSVLDVASSASMGKHDRGAATGTILSRKNVMQELPNEREIRRRTR
jgi:hypothetical protein